MTDKERILMHVIDRLHSTMVLRSGDPQLVWKPQFDHSGEFEYANFAHYKKPQPGDLVFCRTSFPNDWKVAWYVEPLNERDGGAVLREIGSNRLCNYRNEEFIPVVGLLEDDILEGHQREFLLKTWKAFRRGGEYLYRYGGIKFEDKHWVRITIREAFGGIDHRSVPFTFEMKWNRRTSIAEILRQMRAAGYGTRKFERKTTDQEPAVDPVRQ